MNSPLISDEDFKRLYPHKPNIWLQKHFKYNNVQSVKNRAHKLGIKKAPGKRFNGILDTEHTTKPTKEDEMKRPENAPTVESRHDDRVIINWTTRTVITDLGEFGSMSVSFNTHGAIQRYYVDGYEGKGHTASEVAMKFNFPHAKAVYIYAKLHGFTKASLGQTDLEFEEGLTVEDAVRENIQALKRRTYKKTELKKWREIQKDADSWNDFQNAVYFPMKDWVEENLPTWKAPKYTPNTPSKEKAWVVGLSDFHYLKWAYNHQGKTVFNRKIAEKLLLETNCKLITDGLLQGKPEKIYIPMGNDNYSVDNIFETTTAGTPQTGQIDGNWRIDLENYFRLCINTIEVYAQIAPVTIVPMEGNHDKHTSITLHLFLKLLFQNRQDIFVIDNIAPRVYTQYGKNAFMFTHGDSMSQPKLKRSAHKFFMAEAQAQGIKIHQVTQNIMFSGHIHTDSYEDLGAVKHFIIPSLAPPDQWHTDKGYVGNRQEASLYIFDKKGGRKAVLYA